MGRSPTLIVCDPKNRVRSTLLRSVSNPPRPVEHAIHLAIENKATGKPIEDRNGNPAFVDFWSTDSTAYREFNAGAVRDRDFSLRLIVAMTFAWHLVGPGGEPIDAPCTPDNVRAMYLETPELAVAVAAALRDDARNRLNARVAHG